MKKVLIVGQGLAGTAISVVLMQQGITHTVYDAMHKSSSSMVAAGIVQPITGRRLALAQGYIDYLATAKKHYTYSSELMGTTTLQPTRIIEIFSDIKHRNDWMARSGEEQITALRCLPMNAEALGGIQAPLGAMSFDGWVLSCSEYISGYRKFLEGRNQLVNAPFAMAQATYRDCKWEYEGEVYSHIVLCEGANAADSTAYTSIPFQRSKGEILIIHAPTLHQKSIISKGIYILPIGGDRYKVGSNYEWDYKDALPSKHGMDGLKTKLDNLLCETYQIVDHMAAIRPTVKNREPIVQACGPHGSIGILNGLGSKGVLLAPALSQQLLYKIFRNNKPM